MGLRKSYRRVAAGSCSASGYRSTPAGEGEGEGVGANYSVLKYIFIIYNGERQE